MPNPRGYLNVVVPEVLVEALARHRLHPRMALHQVIEVSFVYWRDQGGWTPYPPAPVEDYNPEPVQPMDWLRRV